VNETKISWTTASWNPVSGCSKVSAGCRFCYAERLSHERGWSSKPWTVANEAENVVLKPHKLREPFHLKEPSRIFVNSMSDLFHRAIPTDYLTKIWDVMLTLPEHTFQILTKRPEHAATWPGPWASNLWMGTSVEDRKSLHRLETLRACGARIKFISFEPLLEDLGPVDLTGFQWVIVGGESGPGFRPMDHAWARSVRDQAKAQGIAFFFKQSAAWRTEVGTSLIEADGTKTFIQQFPDVAAILGPGVCRTFDMSGRRRLAGGCPLD